MSVHQNMRSADTRLPIAQILLHALLVRHNGVGRRVGLDPKGGIGDQPYLGGGGLLKFAVGAAPDTVLPRRQVALLGKRAGDRAGIIAAERVEFVAIEADHDFILYGNNPEQIYLLLGPCALCGGEHQDGHSAAPHHIAPSIHAFVLSRLMTHAKNIHETTTAAPNWRSTFTYEGALSGPNGFTQ